MRFWWTLLNLAAFLCAGVPRESSAEGPWAVHVMNADGSEVQRVRYDPQSMFGSPTWLHDGKQIAYDGGQRGFDDSHIFVQKLGESVARDIGAGNTPCFSPDDQQVAF
jgi:Tol biopolymer transport system component